MSVENRTFFLLADDSFFQLGSVFLVVEKLSDVLDDHVENLGLYRRVVIFLLKA